MNMQIRTGVGAALRQSSLGLLLAAALVPASPVVAASADGFVLEKVVQVTRHGVRPPTAGNVKAIDAATLRDWPAWTVEPGHLTGHGYSAVVEMARYRASELRERGLFSDACPSTGEVYAWASPMQRTRATAEAMLDGLFPGCGLQAGSVPGDMDALFQADKMGFAPLDEKKAREGILKSLGGSEEVARRRLEPTLDKLQKAVCQPGKPCPFVGEPWKLARKEDGRFAVDGLTVASDMGETFRLQYSEGLPLDQVAFGHARTPAEVSALMELHKAKYDFINDTPYIATRGGSQLMNQIALAVRQGTELERNDPLGNPPSTSLLLLVAHDTNISYLRTMLGFTWKLGDYPQGNIPPGGTLAFERYVESKTGKRFVRVVFEGQSMDQIRNLTRLEDGERPLMAEFKAGDNCRQASVGLLCPLNEVSAKLEAIIDKTALKAYEYP